MKGEKLFRNVITNKLEIPEEVAFNTPLIRLLGNSLCTIENHMGIIEYTFERIRLNSKIGIIKITGLNLTIKEISRERITIEGNVSGIEYIV